MYRIQIINRQVTPASVHHMSKLFLSDVKKHSDGGQNKMTNLTDNLTKEIRASSLDQERPSWLVGFVNEHYFFSPSV